MTNNTHEIRDEREERAVLVSLITGGQRSQKLAEESLQELVRLAETAAVTVVGSLAQNKDRPDPKWLIGKGKVEELKNMAEELEADTIIFDQELTGMQVRNLEQILNQKIIDRTQLILDIFAGRAKTREGIIQVELAQLSYLLPRLSGHGVHLSRLGGGIGTRGPGETKLETDRRHIRTRISDLKRQLAEVVSHRKLHRERRKKTGVFQVALVGYTNAGKSTLLQQLTHSEVFVENQLFATLDPLSRMLPLPGGHEVMLTDTVGFIQNLPHDLVAAFRATLEEVCEADLILHVIDSSSGMRDEQIRVVEEVLRDLGAHGKEKIGVFNKIDLCPPEEIELLTTSGDFVRISAYSESDLERLMDVIQRKLQGEIKHFRVPAHEGEIISHIYRVGDVLQSDVDEEHMRFEVRVHQKEFAQLSDKLAQYEVQAVESVQ